jgi:hypothetical protein
MPCNDSLEVFGLGKKQWDNQLRMVALIAIFKRPLFGRFIPNEPGQLSHLHSFDRMT